MQDLSHICFLGVDGGVDGAAIDTAAPGRRRARWTSGAALVSRRREQAEVEADPFLIWLLERFDLEAAAYRAPALQRRLAACLRQLRVPSGADARALLVRRPDLAPKALGAVLIGMSGFFRDRPVFDALRDLALPALLDDCADRADRSGIGVCSVGASDGQELYSVAFLLHELGALSDAGRLVGIDRRSEAVERARRGIYEAREVAPLEPAVRDRFFVGKENRFRVRDEIARRLEWRIGNALHPRRDESWDLILFRNVSIYLTDAAATAAWTALHAQLNPGGFLVTGKAEIPPPHLALQKIAPSLYRKGIRP
ncbi:chemotaxis protein methyltransferase CheR/two-component system, chemotaxis family, CheB/CheR fusion protein [Verrucomicrobium sp. GAS474]|uniref:CheR family methyltransferase n=1 Tax=Verrucomicrobium sp. GAS474 TaxID=1882831 RepID=UPI00087DE161|nr:CheR family methyltransferase [Verrucomicrobium sp. GAS474]SDT95287.1 chemotaxis protein methyltransferase CheR/two-component system, chemotaxis family, CheB/CheR fusion protein [Verrucomicrobium sp. GAS474]